MNSREAEVFEEDQKRRSTPLCTGWAAVLAEIQCGRREIPADHPDAIRYGKRLESVEEFATRIAHLAASTQSETKRTVKYVRMPIYDKRIGNGDDYAGDAWVRWTAVGQIPEDLDASTSTVR